MYRLVDFGHTQTIVLRPHQHQIEKRSVSKLFQCFIQVGYRKRQILFLWQIQRHGTMKWLKNHSSGIIMHNIETLSLNKFTFFIPLVRNIFHWWVGLIYVKRWNFTPVFCKNYTCTNCTYIFKWNRTIISGILSVFHMNSARAIVQV